MRDNHKPRPEDDLLSYEEVVAHLEEALEEQKFNTFRRWAGCAYRKGSGINPEPPIDPESLFRLIKNKVIIPFREKQQRIEKLKRYQQENDTVPPFKPLDKYNPEAQKIRQGLIQGLCNGNDLILLQTYFSAYARYCGNELLDTLAIPQKISLVLSLLECPQEKYKALRNNPVALSNYLNSINNTTFRVAIWLGNTKRNIEFRFANGGYYAMSVHNVICKYGDFYQSEKEPICLQELNGNWVWRKTLPQKQYRWSDEAEKEPLLAVRIASCDDNFADVEIEVTEPRACKEWNYDLHSVSNSDDFFLLVVWEYQSKYPLWCEHIATSGSYRLANVMVYRAGFDNWFVSPHDSGFPIHPLSTNHVKEGDFVEPNKYASGSFSGVYMLSKVIKRDAIPQAILVKMRMSFQDSIKPVTFIKPLFMLQKYAFKNGCTND